MLKSTAVVAAACLVTGAHADDIVGPFIPGEIIVKFTEPQANAQAVVGAALGGDVTWTSPRHAPHAKGQPGTPHPLSYYRVAHVDPHADVAALSQLIDVMPGVDWASVNGAPEPAFTPNDPFFNQQWQHQKINSEAGWDYHTGSHDIIMGIIDTGCTVSHEDLVDNLWTNPGEIPGNGIDDDNNGFIDDIYGWDFVQNNAGVEDVFGHGTEVSGITSAGLDNGIGVSGLANTLVMTGKWWHTGGSDMSVAESVYYCVDNGAHVTNMSLSCGCLMPATEEATLYATANGVLNVAAAGNAGGIAPHYPASYENVMSVMAITQNDQRANFSNFGPLLDCGAPSPEILTTDSGGGYDFGFGGTSAASPHVAGLAGLMLSLDPSLTPDEVRAIINDTAEDLGDPGFDNIFGNGRIQVGAAMEVVAEGACPADFNGDGNLDILDFVAFQAAWTAGDPSADCDDSGTFDILDFVCFQAVFSAGCP